MGSKRHRNRDLRSPSPTPPRYAAGLLAAAQAVHMRPRGVYSVEVRHDADCALLAGRSACNCSPVVGAVEAVQ